MRLKGDKEPQGGRGCPTIVTKSGHWRLHKRLGGEVWRAQNSRWAVGGGRKRSGLNALSPFVRHYTEARVREMNPFKARARLLVKGNRGGGGGGAFAASTPGTS